jgi:hypothetical protein
MLNHPSRGGNVTDLSTGAYASDNSPGGETSRTKQVAEQGAQAAGHAATDVKDTAVEQAQRVGAETKAQARNLAGDVRDRLSEQARTQNDRLAGSIRETADQLDEMRGDRSDSPAATVVARVADGGRQLADYLDRNGPEGVLREVQDFARRRPGAFLATALAAGFVVGRLGKGVAKADSSGTSDRKPAGDAYAHRYEPPTATEPPATATYPEAGTAGTYPEAGTAGSYAAEPPGTYATGTEYAATGTGRPMPLTEEYPETRR